MRRFAFIIAFLGMLVLVFMLNGVVVEVKNYSDLDDLEINQRVLVAGEVVGERLIFGGSKILILESGLELVCECSGNFEGKMVRAEGVISEFKEKKQISVLTVYVLR